MGLEISTDEVSVSKSSMSRMSEDIRWIVFSSLGLLIGFLLWQPLIALIIAALWLWKTRYNEQIIINILCFNLISCFKSIRCRQLFYLCCNKGEYVEYHVIDSIILKEDDKKGNEQ